jgi:sulfur relay (sulfurtransferase) DsrC/TusE family protein
MATAPGRTLCVTCGKERATSKCGGCLQDFCYNDFEQHRQELSKQLDEVEVNCDLCRLTFTEQTTDLQKHPLIQEINDWEGDSISKIRQAADEARQLIFEHTNKHLTDIEVQLNKLTIQLRQCRRENDFFETDLNQWKNELQQLTRELAKLTNIKLRREYTPYLTKIYADISCGKYDIICRT